MDARRELIDILNNSSDDFILSLLDTAIKKIGAKTRVYKLNEICVDDETIQFTNPISVKLEIDENGDFSINNEEFDIYVTESTYTEAITEFQSWLEFSYSQYVLESDENLTEDAIEYKTKLLTYIGKV